MTRRKLLAGVGSGLVLTAAGTVRGTLAQRTVQAGQPAPEVSAGAWINSAPLAMAQLRGRVVLVDFWTAG